MSPYTAEEDAIDDQGGSSTSLYVLQQVQRTENVCIQLLRRGYWNGTSGRLWAAR